MATVLFGLLSIGMGSVRGPRGGGLGRRPDAGDLFAVGESGGGLPGAGRREGPSRCERSRSPRARGEIALVNQQGLQFTPRVQAIVLGQGVRFGNKDSENHNVHVVTPGFAFNQSMAPGNSVDFTPDRPGVMILACDIHSHMRGFVVVSPTPWVQVCSRQGRFRLEDVPDGRYVLNVWHEMGEPLRQEIVVAGGKAPGVAGAGADRAFEPGPDGRDRDARAPVVRGDRPDRRDPGGEPERRDPRRRAGQGAAAGR